MICHQVNEYGVMGAGIAKQIKDTFQPLYDGYKSICGRTEKDSLYGCVWFYFYGNPQKAVANCFSQRNGVTNIDDLKKCVKSLHKIAAARGYKTIGIPYKYGCGIATGEWEEVEQVFKNEFEHSKIDLQVWRL